MLDMADMETGLWSDEPRMDTRCLLRINEVIMTKHDENNTFEKGSE